MYSQVPDQILFFYWNTEDEFARRKPEFHPLVVNDKTLEIVTGVTVLSLNISNDLK